jgi:hypothetical protein
MFRFSLRHPHIAFEGVARKFRTLVLGLVFVVSSLLMTLPFAESAFADRKCDTYYVYVPVWINGGIIFVPVEFQVCE